MTKVSVVLALREGIAPRSVDVPAKRIVNGLALHLKPNFRDGGFYRVWQITHVASGRSIPLLAYRELPIAEVEPVFHKVAALTDWPNLTVEECAVPGHPIATKLREMLSNAGGSA